VGINILLMVENAVRSIKFYRHINFNDEMFLKYKGHVYFGEMSYNDNYRLMFLEKKWWNFSEEINEFCIGKGVLIYIPVTDIDTVYKKIPNSAKIIYQPKNFYYGREFVIQDEDGYKVSFFQNYEKGEIIKEGMEKWERKEEKKGELCDWVEK